MGKTIRHLRGESQREIIKLLDGLCGRYSRWDVWQDFIIMSATSIANVLGGPHRESREKAYLERAGKYSDAEMVIFSQMLCAVTEGMEENPDQDFLGELFMALELGNEWRGQFFTPYDVCRMMAAMNFGSALKEAIESRGWVSVSDPACGAGALLIAFANECRREPNNVNYQTSVLFVAQDIDYLAGLMCYIQLSLMGCPGYVVIDDSLLRPSTSHDGRGLIPIDGPQVWYTPMYYRDIWHWRRVWAQSEFLFRQGTTAPEDPAPTTVPEPTPEPENPATPEPMLNESKGGQLTFF